MRPLFICLFAVCWLCQLSATAQLMKEGKFFLMKEDGTHVSSIEDAVYFIEVIQQNDTSFQCNTYNKNGPLIAVQTFRDKDLTIPHGLFAWYDSTGCIDSMGTVYYRKKDGDWSVFDDSLKVRTVSHYDHGKLLWKQDIRNHSYLFRDPSLPPAKLGEPRSLALAYYPGGQKAWTRYLEKNLRMPDRLKQLAGRDPMQVTVVVNFIVDSSGETSGWTIFRSSEWSVDKESLRVISESGRWSPATRDGVAYDFRQTQSITYVLR